MFFLLRQGNSLRRSGQRLKVRAVLVCCLATGFGKVAWQRGDVLVIEGGVGRSGDVKGIFVRFSLGNARPGWPSDGTARKEV